MSIKSPQNFAGSYKQSVYNQKLKILMSEVIRFVVKKQPPEVFCEKKRS